MDDKKIKNLEDVKKMVEIENLMEQDKKQEEGQVDAIVMRIREKCNSEIKWVKESLDEHAQLGNYTDADTHYLPGYRKAFEEILELIKDA